MPPPRLISTIPSLYMRSTNNNVLASPRIYRRLLATTSNDVVLSPPKEKAPLRSRMAWFTTGLAITLGLGLYQVGADASQAAQDLDEELKKLRDETVKTQTVLRSRIAKLEAQLGSLAVKSQSEDDR